MVLGRRPKRWKACWWGGFGDGARRAYVFNRPTMCWTRRAIFRVGRYGIRASSNTTRTAATFVGGNAVEPEANLPTRWPDAKATFTWATAAIAACRCSTTT